MRDDQIFNLIEKEKLREKEHIELIASEKFYIFRDKASCWEYFN